MGRDFQGQRHRFPRSRAEISGRLPERKVHCLNKGCPTWSRLTCTKSIPPRKGPLCRKASPLPICPGPREPTVLPPIFKEDPCRAAPGQSEP